MIYGWKEEVEGPIWSQMLLRSCCCWKGLDIVLICMDSNCWSAQTKVKILGLTHPLLVLHSLELGLHHVHLRSVLHLLGCAVALRVLPSFCVAHDHRVEHVGKSVLLKALLITSGTSAACHDFVKHPK